jgi:pimeloyl-ACP methyl ester carboxylesterase
MSVPAAIRRFKIEQWHDRHWLAYLPVLPVATLLALPLHAAPTTYPAPQQGTSQVTTSFVEVVSATGCQDTRGDTYYTKAFPAGENITPPFGGIASIYATGQPYPGTITLPSDLNTILTLTNGVSGWQGSMTSNASQPYSNPAGSVIGKYVFSVSGSVVTETYDGIYAYDGDDNQGHDAGSSHYSLSSAYDIVTGIQQYTFSWNLVSTNTNNPNGPGCVVVQTATQNGASTAYYYSPPSCSATIDLLDPTSGMVKQTENGVQLTNDPAVLAKAGRLVQGAVADGVSQLLLRVHVTDPKSSCGVIAGSIQNSSVVPRGSVTPLNGGLADKTSHMAFLLYTPPPDFVSSANLADKSEFQRTATVDISANGQVLANQPILLSRPPVVLIHGLWDSPNSWFSLDAHLFTQFLADYSAPVSFSSSVPSVSSTFTKGNALGFGYAALLVEPEINQFLEAFRAGQNVLEVPLAAAQLDVVGHSMGGDIGRYLTLQPSYTNASNFGKGYIHKLITIGTPHFGSALPNYLLGGTSATLHGPSTPKVSDLCVAGYFRRLGLDVFVQVDTSQGKFDGAIYDLQGDGRTANGASDAIKVLQVAPTLPVAFVAGQASSSQLAGLDNSPTQRALTVLCSTDPIATYFTSALWPVLMAGGSAGATGVPSDGIVPLSSQLNGHDSSAVQPAPFQGVVHSRSTALLGFGGEFELDAAGPVPAAVIDLLNRPLSDNAFSSIP